MKAANNGRAVISAGEEVAPSKQLFEKGRRELGQGHFKFEVKCHGVKL